MDMRTIKRICLGLLTMVAILMAFDLVPNLTPDTWVRYRIFGIFYFWSAVEGASVMFVGACGGAYVARVPFVVPAVVVAAVVWLLVLYFANSIAATAGQGDIFAVARSNILGLLFGGIGAAAGSVLGRYLSTQQESGATNAA